MRTQDHPVQVSEPGSPFLYYLDRAGRIWEIVSLEMGEGAIRRYRPALRTVAGRSVYEHWVRARQLCFSEWLNQEWFHETRSYIASVRRSHRPYREIWYYWFRRCFSGRH